MVTTEPIRLVAAGAAHGLHAGQLLPPPPSTGYYHSLPTSSRHPYYPLPPVQASPPPNRAPPSPYSPTPLPPLRQSHHSPPYALHRTPPYGAAYAASGELPSFDEVRTLFIAGLPGDVKVREVHNLFREFPEYESAQLRSSGWSSQAYAFSFFTDQQSALAAMHSLNGLLFDLERESRLHIDLAKSNSRSKWPRTDENIYSSDRGVRGSAAYSRDFRDSDVAAIIPHMGTHSSKAHVYTFWHNLHTSAGSNTHMSGMIYSSCSGYPSTQSNKKLAYDSEHNNLYSCRLNILKDSSIFPLVHLECHYSTLTMHDFTAEVVLSENHQVDLCQGCQ